jgi:hypothetical protein
MTSLSLTYARLRATDPARWREAAAAWRRQAGIAERWAAAIAAQTGRVTAAWTGGAATAAAAFLERLCRTAVLVRLHCWAADQALSEWAGALERARALLDRGVAIATRAGLRVDDDGRVTPAVAPHFGQAMGPIQDGLRIAAEADGATTARLAELADSLMSNLGTQPLHLAPPPPLSAPPAEVERWWSGLGAEQRFWLIATAPDLLGGRDGIPAADRDLANRLRATVPADVAARLDDPSGPRGYLLELDQGRIVLAAGDPDRASTVLTHVPGMTADLASYARELGRAERVATRAGELDPGTAASAVLWLGYDAPAYVHEAASADRATAGGRALRQFQEGLRATHVSSDGRLTVLGHSYGSLVVGSAARTPGLDADAVVLVGSPGVGVDRAADLATPAVYAMTSLSDPVQYAAPAPAAVVEDVALSRLIGPLIPFGLPEDDLWHGTNPADDSFGARVVPSQPDAGHSGYWDPGRPALDGLASITLGRSTG